MDINETIREKSSFNKRLIFLYLIFGIMGVVFYYQIFNLQISNYSEYEIAAKNNKNIEISVQPLRGIIFDRNGEILVNNIPTFDLITKPYFIDNPDDFLLALSSFLMITNEEKKNFLEEFDNAKALNKELTLIRSITDEEKAKFLVRSHSFKNAYVGKRYLRNYLYPEIFSHSIGYVGRPNEEELDKIYSSLNLNNKINFSYTNQLLVGKTGLEVIYEDTLKGEFGTNIREVDARGRTIDEAISASPKTGNNLYTSLDLKSHQAANKALNGRKGAIVAIDIKDGSIVTLFSSPTFSANQLANGILKRDFDQLLSSNEKPFFNRALKGRYPPASSIKPAIAIYGIEEELIDWDFSLFDEGFFTLPEDGRIYRDWKEGGHGNTNLFKAITQSSNTYFFDLAYRSDINKLNAHLLSLGFGDKACIDCFEEDRVFVPNPSWKMNKHNFGWFKGDTVNMGVGQGYLVSTPIQLAKYAYIIANKGKYSDLSLKKDLVKNEMNIQFNKFSNDDWYKLHESMVNVIEGNTGTARRLKEKKSYVVAAKTGTAELVSADSKDQYVETRQDDSLRDHALIIAFGPIPNPRYAVSVVVENGESGGSVAGPVAISVLNSLIQE
tara:strand:- start:5631 stop:7460 length:1830 start_codon:yes stop_codon:yes gene_type:complete